MIFWHDMHMHMYRLTPSIYSVEILCVRAVCVCVGGGGGVDLHNSDYN